MSILLPNFNVDTDPVVWTRGTAAPSGGKDGDRYTKITANPESVKNGTIYRNFAGTWRAIGRENDWWSHAVQNGWSIMEGTDILVPPTVDDTGPYTLNGGTLTKTASSLDFSGSTSGAYWRQRLLHVGTLYGAFQLSTLPSTAGVASLNIGVGNYYGPCYPYFTIDATTRLVTVEGVSTGITAQANDVFSIVSMPGMSLMTIERGSTALWQGQATAYYTVGWASEYGKGWSVFATGLLTAGVVAVTERGVVGP